MAIYSTEACGSGVALTSGAAAQNLRGARQGTWTPLCLGGEGLAQKVWRYAVKRLRFRRPIWPTRPMSVQGAGPSGELQAAAMTGVR